MALLLLAGGAHAQDSFVFSLSATGQGSFGDLEDAELARYDASRGAVQPWLRMATGAFFAGDLTGDGKVDELEDIDVLALRPGQGGSIGEVLVSLVSDLGPFKDGDLLRLLLQGGLEVALSETRMVQDFGITDGNCDLDAFQFSETGIHWVSFAEDEASSILSTDGSGKINDGALVWWNPATTQVGVVYSEAQIDALVSTALGSTQTTGDLLSVAANAAGDVLFSVQSPSAHDGSVFSDQNGGTLVQPESSLGFSSTVEIDALAIDLESVEFLSVGATPRVVPSGSSFTVTVHGAPDHEFWMLFSLSSTSAANHPGPGFYGLFLSPADPLLWWSLSATWLQGRTDSTGLASLSLGPAPAGFSGTVYGQAYHAPGRSFGTPVLIELQ